MKHVTFYHAGCPVCISAEHMLIDSLDKSQYQIDIVHLGEKQDQYSVAVAQGVKSVPALVMNDQVYHINFGASMDDIKP